MEKLRTAARNLGRNWYFPLCAVTFFCTSFEYVARCPAALVLALLLCTAAAAAAPSLLDRVRGMDWKIKALSALTALGAFWDPRAAAFGGISLTLRTELLYGELMAPLRLPYVLGDLSIAAAWVFAFLCIALFWEKLTGIFRETGLLRELPLWERCVYGAMFLISAAGIALVYSKTGVFSGQAVFDYDLIYTSDTAEIVTQGSYVRLFQEQNDIRQPLYAAFAAPFTGLAYLLGTLVYSRPALQVLLLDLTQLGLILLGTFFLTRMLELKPLGRVCFLALSCCCYPYLLFGLMMEQYAVAYFWLTLCLFLIWQGREEPIALWGAGGTLLTSLALLPLMPDCRKGFRAWFLGCVKQGLLFLGVLLMLCRFDVIWDMKEKLSYLGTFTGEKLTLWDKGLQYISFLSACFLAPETVILPTGWLGNPSWQLAPVTDIHPLGLILLALTLLSLWIHRRRRSSLLCGYWVVFSLVILVVMGWGTAENGLILYALYFGWAYFCLLFQLAQTAGERLQKKWLLPLLSAALGGVLLAVNIPGMAEMIRFAVTHYPG